MFDFLKQIDAKATAERYIESCKTLNHIKTMEKYLDIYKEKFEDFLGHSILSRLLSDKQELIINKK